MVNQLISLIAEQGFLHLTLRLVVFSANIRDTPGSAMTLHQMITSESAYIDFGKELKNVFKSTLDVEHHDSSVKVGNIGEGKKFRGVTKHKRTQRYEAHIWECKKQIYLGGFDSEYLAARSHDIMALRCKGADCETLNFPREDYDNLVHLLPMLNKEDLIAILRNYSKGNLQPASTAVVPQANAMREGNGVSKFKYKYSSLYSGSPKSPQIRLPLSGTKRSAEGWTSPDTPLCAQKLAPKSPRTGNMHDDDCLLPVVPFLENPCCPDDIVRHLLLVLILSEFDKFDTSILRELPFLVPGIWATNINTNKCETAGTDVQPYG